MSLRHLKAWKGGRRPLTRSLLAATAVVLIVATSMAGAGAEAGDGTAEDAQVVAEAKETESAIVAAWNDKKWDDLRVLYAEDAVVFIPNQEPVQGRDAIIEYFQRVRDVVGEIDDGYEYIRVNGSGDFASLTGKVTFGSGRFRMTYNDVYERQPDGSVLIAINQVAFRERPLG